MSLNGQLWWGCALRRFCFYLNFNPVDRKGSHGGLLGSQVYFLSVIPRIALGEPLSFCIHLWLTRLTSEGLSYFCSNWCLPLIYRLYSTRTVGLHLWDSSDYCLIACVFEIWNRLWWWSRTFENDMLWGKDGSLEGDWELWFSGRKTLTGGQHRQTQWYRCIVQLCSGRMLLLGCYRVVHVFYW